MAFSPMTYAQRDGRAGFTLTEILVAIAIFLSLLGGVTALFVGSVRTVRQGFQNQEAFELARSTLKIIERDLNRAFTARDRGEFYSFYGTPIGFTFVGLEPPRQDRPSDNLARVTYVVRQNLGQNLQDLEGDRRNAVALIRYVEPDVNDLNQFPVNWEQDVSGPEESAYTLRDILHAECQQCLNSGGLVADEGVSACRLSNQEIVNAKKRELWIRMLAGGDADVPDAWGQELGTESDPVDTNGTLPSDFVVAENIVHVLHLGNHNATTSNGLGLSLQLLETWFQFSPSDAFFEDTNQVPAVPAEFQSSEADARQFLNNATRRVVPLGNVDGEPLRPPRIDPRHHAFLGVNNVNNFTPNTYPAQDYFFTYGAVVQTTGGQQVEYRSYWNDIRNMLNQNQQCVGKPTEAVGTPLRPRLPQQVTSHFTLFFESPYPGAGDFEKTFDQRIDIPTGYHRFKDDPSG